MSLTHTVNEPRYPVTSDQLCLHDLLSRQAAHTPDVVAVAEATRSLTYRDLEEQANRLAHILRAQGVGPERVVGLALEQGRGQLEAVVALFAILKAGGAVLTLSSYYPPATLRRMLEETHVTAIVAVQRSEALRMEEVATKHQPILCLEDVRVQQQISRQPTTSPALGVTPHTLAYVMYTSGSTGIPKGVLCEHIHLAPLGLAQGERYQVTAEDRIGHAFSWQFDGIWSVLATAIANGATLCLPEYGVLDSGAHTVAWMERERITLMFCTPSYLATWPEIHLPDHPAIVAAGESCPEDLARNYAATCRFYTAYGPAEGGICATTGLYRGDGPPTIGHPLPYVDLVLVDEQGHPVPPGEEGEILIRAPHARGYTNPRLTAERFQPDGYHTGDFATQRPDGTFLFAGRKDAQLKLPGGVLCNLEQVEQVLGAHPGVLACKALWRDPLGIVLYVVLKGRGQLSTRALRAYLADWLPEPIVSRCVSVELEALPLTPNGKADPNPDHYPLPTVRDLVEYVGEFRAPTTAPEIALAQLVADLTSGPFSPADAQEINVLATLSELGLDSLSLGALEVKIAAAFHQNLSEEQVFTWPLYRIADALVGGTPSFPDREVR